MNEKVLRHKEICDGLNELYARKNHDYGDSFHTTFVEEGLAMARIRLGDKFSRFKTLSRLSCNDRDQQQVTDESIRDTVEEIPGTKRSLVRLYQNVEACKIAKDAEDKEGLDGFQYDEYCVEVESWPGLAASVRENYDTYLAKGKDNEVDRSNYALFRAQKNTDSIVQDTDAMSVDHEYRLTLLELGLSE